MIVMTKIPFKCCSQSSFYETWTESYLSYYDIIIKKIKILHLK